MRLLLTLFFLLALPVSAGYNDRSIEIFGGVGYVDGTVPAVATVDGFTADQTNGGTLTFSSTLAITAGSPVFVFAHDCATPPSGGNALTKEPSARSFGSSPVTVDWLPDNYSGCLSISHLARAKRSSAATSAAFNLPSPGGGAGSGAGNLVNWNPGVYLGYKPDQFFNVSGDHTQGYRTARSVLANSAMCQGTATAEMWKGVRVKMEWWEYELFVGDYSLGDGLVDDILDFAHSRECGESSPGARDGRTFSLIFAADPKGFKNPDGSDGDCFNAIAGGGDGPFNNSQNLIIRQGGGGSAVAVCGARVYDPSAPVQAAYTAFIQHFLNRYGNDELLEAFSMRVEGSSSVYNDDPLFGNGAIFQEYIRDLNVLLRNGGQTKFWSFVGTNNYRAGHNDQLITIHLPSMNATGGQGVSHPDTFDDTPPGQSAHAPFYPATNGSINNGPAGQVLHAHLSEFQRAGRTFTSIPGVIEQCCDPTYTHPNADLSSYFGGPPSTTAYGTTHAVVITTFGQYPTSDFEAEFNSRPRGWTLFDDTCPDAWLAAGLTCVDRDGSVVP